ncbi:2-hydroxyacid dehydrogenase [Treponema phagedenis]|uniref:2-hydroxyacid dehydrogenase n=1 Tax=Treponema phagedenis TaxID=162 RepID=UPI001582274B|nr:2-hydroxyacid dehydrogenase [Treponema phagedenis]NVP25157.1 hydroxyacid dehydrogenase [Treponema phagedenis]QKS93216.1 hydroxyacid dehydrogenase [Treponema phagedenis]QLC59156.1 hydroxyacid dehydrogenase [Treponema phagedenis]
MKINLIEPLGVKAEIIEDLAKQFSVQGHEFKAYDSLTKDIAELKKRTADADVVMIGSNPLPNEVIENAEKLKLLSVAFTGIDHVGQAACKSKNIVITNAAGYSNESVAELVIGFAINLLRNMKAADEATRKGGTGKSLIGNELMGKTVGIIGAGRIGTRVAKLFKAFDCEVFAYSNHESDELKKLGVKYFSLNEVMKNSDIISLHLPLNDSTKGFISKEKIALMKENAFLINCARGPIVDNTALAEALNARKIRGAAIDVFDMEPPIPSDYPLLHAKNTILTPHVAYATDESMITRAKIAFSNVYAWLNGKPKNEVKY